MSNHNGLLCGAEIAARRKTGVPLFQLGRVVITPGALRVLQDNGIQPAGPLAMHQHGAWGAVDDEDAQANDRALREGSRLLSVWTIGNERIWIITEAVDDEGRRAYTTLCLPSEY